MFKARKFATFTIGSMIASMALLTVVFSGTAAADWPWDSTLTPPPPCCTAGTSGSGIDGTNDDDWPWD